MKRWFDRLPVHAKLVTMAVIVTSAALLAAASGLMVFDLWRYRSAADDDAATLARIIAENSAAAVTFGDVAAAQETLGTVRVRPVVTKACIYQQEGRLFAAYERSTAFRCPASVPTPRGFGTVGATAAIDRNTRTWGVVYVERDVSDLGPRIAVTAAAAALMLVLAGALAFLLARRLTYTISRPITELANAVTDVGQDLKAPVPVIATPQDEIGALVRAFQTMIARVKDANEGLRREIDERKRIEVERETLLVSEREANRLKDEFLAAVSHELRTPLNAILGWVQVLGTTRLSEQTTAKAIASIARNAHAQTRVIEDLVDVSRIVTGKLHLRFEPVDLRAAIDAAVDVVRPSTEAKQLALDVQALCAHCFVNGDRDRLQQIVWNLLSNAIKFTGTGGNIAVTLQRRGPVYEIEVRDTGSGIAADFLPHVFDRFRQADGSMTREHGGLGLGLAIVKELTEKHGGSVTATSAGPGKGASFVLRFPALIGSDLPFDHVDDDEEVEPASLAGVRVLVVDDNVDALDVMTEALTAAGATVRTARSGAEAIQEWTRNPPDVVMCDLAMPDMDGYEVLRTLHELGTLSRPHAPVIAVSAHATTEYLEKTRQAGFAAHLAKPYRTAELVKIVASAVSRT